MLVKGIVSAIYEEDNKISVILPEYDSIVTFPLSIYGGTKAVGDYEINEFVLVAVFDDFNDAVIMGK